ncbi:MAG: ADOP family duplicated permease [Vicinamibacteraceae bacterium]
MIGDLRHAWRALRAIPLVSTVIVVSLGLGIGANTTVFSWLQMVRWKPLPGVAGAAALQTLETRTATGAYVGTSWRRYLDVQERTRSFDWLLASRATPLAIGAAPAVERATALFVSGNYFQALALRPAAGRLLSTDDAGAPGRQPVVVISHDYWQTHFGGGRSAVGAAIRANGQTLEIIGVTPPRFQGTTLGLAFDMWIPATMAGVLIPGSRELDDRAQGGYTVLGRLRPEVSAIAAQAELDAVAGTIGRAHPETDGGLAIERHDFNDPPRGPQRMIAGALALLQALMLLVLIAVCGNVANLLLARASVRQREFGVRLALGAPRHRIARLVLFEALLLAAGGTAIGLALALWGTQAVRAGEISGAMPIRFQTAIDGVGLAVAVGLGLLCALVAAGTPAWLLTRLQPQDTTRSGIRGASRSVLRDTLMGLQVALALLVLVVAGLFFQRFQEGRGLDPGFRADGILLAAYDRTGGDTTRDSNRAFASRLLRALRQVPGVEAAALASSVPLDIHGLPSRTFALEGRPDTGTPDQALSNTVTRGYLATMGIPLVAGTDLADLDDATAAPQVIVNQAFVARFVPEGEVLGRRLVSRDVSHVIVGIARTSTADAFGEAPAPLVLYSYRDRPLAGAEMHLRTRPGTELAMTAAIRRVVAELDPSLPVFDVRTLPEHIARNLILRRVPARMFLVLGPLLLLLAAIGVYAVVDYGVSQRTREIAVRLALGASSQSVVRRIVGETVAVIGLGAGGATLMAVAVDLHLIRGGTRDLPVLVGVPLLLLLVGALAAWLPARRASRVQPANVLRTI